MIINVPAGFTKEQLDWLAREAKREGVSRSEVLRRLVDKGREKPKTKG